MKTPKPCKVCGEINCDCPKPKRKRYWTDWEDEYHAKSVLEGKKYRRGKDNENDRKH